MPGNSIGKTLILTTFGESHGAAVGGVLDGFPSNISIDLNFIQTEVNRRRPGLAFYSSPRKEEDQVEILSGLYAGKSTGAPIAFLVHNRDHHPADYDSLSELYRPSHADFTYQQKYGIRDPRGGGRASARETVARVIGGAFAKILLQKDNILIRSRISQIGPYAIIAPEHSGNDPSEIDLPAEVIDFLNQLKTTGDTTGGIITGSITGVPAGLGEPVFDKLQADLAKAMLSINSVKGFDFGSGFQSTMLRGSEHNDTFIVKEGKIATRTNHSGGIQGGISNGEEIYFRVAFKPVSTLMMEQETLTNDGKPITFSGTGRHDICVVPRALPIVEAMAALTIADHLIRKNQESKITSAP
ncbi:MAG: chorismate synthase [Bacteroidales bacterium]|nr:chorismate synthase [Bacteroidales bacterium]